MIYYDSKIGSLQKGQSFFLSKPALMDCFKLFVSAETRGSLKVSISWREHSLFLMAETACC